MPNILEENYFLVILMSLEYTQMQVLVFFLSFDHNMDLSSSTWDWTHSSCTGSMES